MWALVVIIAIAVASLAMARYRGRRGVRELRVLAEEEGLQSKSSGAARRDRRRMAAGFAIAYAALVLFWSVLPRGGIGKNLEGWLMLATGPTGWVRAAVSTPSSHDVPACMFNFLSGSMICVGGLMGFLYIRSDRRLLPFIVAFIAWVLYGLGAMAWDF